MTWNVSKPSASWSDSVQRARDERTGAVLRVCSLLNQHSVRYLIVGARACWLHGYGRATIDVDILVPEL